LLHPSTAGPDDSVVGQPLDLLISDVLIDEGKRVWSSAVGWGLMLRSLRSPSEFGCYGV
jgi:hypothetical protein